MPTAEQIDHSVIPQGTGSRFDSDMVDGIHATTRPYPYCLVPLGPNGQFPISVIPAIGSGGSGFILGSGLPADGNMLVANGTVWNSVPITGAITITDTGVTSYAGTVPTTKGGTGITTYTTGDTLYASATNVLSKLGIGTTGQILTVASGLPSWATPNTTVPGGNVHDIQFNNPLGTFDGVDNLQFTFVDNTTSLLTVQAAATGVTDTAQITVTAGDTGHTSSGDLAQLSLITNGNGGGNPQIVMWADANGNGGSCNIFMAGSGGGEIYWVDKSFSVNHWAAGVNTDSGGKQYYIQNFNLGGSPVALWMLASSKGVGIYNTSPAADTFDVGIATKLETTLAVVGNIIEINGVTTSWPGSQGGVNTVLTNNGSGTLSWASPSALVQSVSTKTSDYPITLSDGFILANAAITVTLPTAVGISGRVFTIKNIVISGLVTVATTSSQTIDGSTSQLLATQYQSIQVISDGANWWII